jgi:ribonuclease-3
LREPIERLSRVIGYDFSDKGVAERALTHRSAGSLNNERQEFLGDAILGFIVADALYHRFSEADEGQLSRLRASLVKRETLAGIARRLDLGQYLALGPGELRSGGQSRDSILADALEALFAAIYLDGGYQQARRVILDLFQEGVSQLSQEGPHKDPKTRLQEYLQARGWSLPSYRIIDVSGEPHLQSFRVECRIEELQLTVVGSGNSRRKAEQAAANQLLDRLTA